ncbi:uncharacterized membrane protein YcaP (DUF421 family) [Deinococcus sp. HSC-46F16]|uniref:YetF domain-containing protein n=1 Tax=Deinococcus sp. HSC-46F16 TaxID=2910968 RepID=UPI00209D5ADE|nr:DUF421 domain-containing protein [Deinococcus sp. HSC-46F16]MCP2015027.1 uncharacterized membrane protein YcaP (DUF421 family) [Deinococcus sp. HSC-46F16]
MSAEVVPLDLPRMFLGDFPPLFFAEIALRTVVIFGWLLLLLRLMGKRGLAQLSPLELAIVIGLGSAAGDPMFYPEVPLAHAMLVLALVVGMQRLLAYLVIKNETVETFIEGVPVELVRDGIMSNPALDRSNLSREDLFERLRVAGVRQLGEVQRVYFEQDGNLSVFLHQGDAPPGLPIVPPWDLEAPVPVREGGQGQLACTSCGAVSLVDGPVPPCPHCGHEDWTHATTDPLGGAHGSARDDSGGDGGDHRLGLGGPLGGGPGTTPG